MFVFRPRAKLNRMFFRLNRLMIIQQVLLVLSGCLLIIFLGKDDQCLIGQLSLFQQNNSLSSKDLLLSSDPGRFSKISVNILGVFSWIDCLYDMLFWAWIYWWFVQGDYLQSINCFNWMVSVVSTCNQLVSILICRPLDILFDIRYISIIAVQLVGFFICVLFAFFLGLKFASVRRRIWNDLEFIRRWEIL